MKKSIMFVILGIFIFCMGSIDVYADTYLDRTNSDIECIYANGIVVGLSYDQALKKGSTYIKEYPVNKSVVIDFEQLSNISLFNVGDAASSLNGSCPSEIRYWIAYEKTNDGSRAYKGVYNFDWNSPAASQDTVTSQLISIKKHGWWIWSSKENVSGVLPVYFKTSGVGVQSNCSSNYVIDNGSVLTEAGGSSCSPEARIPLVGERVYFTGDIPSSSYKFTFKTYSKGQSEAVGLSKYAQMYSDVSNNYLLQVGKTITYLDSGKDNFNKISQYSKDSKDIYICIRESITTQDASKGESSYRFSSTRHEITKVDTKAIDCSSGELSFKMTNEVCKVKTSNSAGSFCDKYTNTAFVLVDIIQIVQVLVPALVIVLTGIEIGKIVLAGNIEEELPKRKKSIIVRLIIMIAFFFLPLITKLIISLAEGVSILDVGCLFNNGEKVNNNDLDEKDCVEIENTPEQESVPAEDPQHSKVQLTE